MVKKNGCGEEEIRNHGLKGPRCMGTCPQTLEKFDQNVASQEGYCGKCIENKNLGGEKEKNEKQK